MIHRELHPDDIPLYDAEVLGRVSVQRYLASLDAEAPGLDLTWDRAVLFGLLATRDVRAGKLQSHRVLAQRTFAADDFDVLIVAALTILDPGPVPPGTFEALLVGDSGPSLCS
ncbi:MAG: hypothetical protein JWM31_220 [Solirubrobacterales bacterium]|nr:hypothetical protein [Solirubrobacterales bacterium]